MSDMLRPLIATGIWNTDVSSVSGLNFTLKSASRERATKQLEARTRFSKKQVLNRTY